ncbi:unnamed protein product [Boreogadus saida]
MSRMLLSELRHKLVTEDFDVEMAADSLINKQIHIWDNMLKVLPNSEPEYVAAKKLFDEFKEYIPELKAKWLPSAKDVKLIWETCRKAIEGLKFFHENMMIKNEL